METISSENNTAAKYDHADCMTSSVASSHDPPAFPINLSLQPTADGRKQRRSSCRPTFVVPIADDGDDDDDDCAFQRDPAGSDEGKQPNVDLPARRRHSVHLALRHYCQRWQAVG